MSKRKNMISCLHRFSPSVFLREECLGYESQEIAKKMLEPLQKEFASRIQEKVKIFLDSKKVIPSTLKGCFVNLDPFVVSIRCPEDSIGDFLDKMEFKIQFVL